MDENKSWTIFGCVVAIVSIFLVCIAGKGCQESDNKVRMEAIQKGCLLLSNNQFDCRSK